MSLEHEEAPEPSDADVQRLAKQMYEAFSTVGFVYIKNHGVLREQVSTSHQAARSRVTLAADRRSPLVRPRLT